MKRFQMAYIVGLLSLLYIPIFIVILYAFNDATYSLMWRGFTVKWFHVLAVYEYYDASNSLLTIYADGVQNSNATLSGALSDITTTNPLNIGDRSGGTDRTFNGTIKDVKIWNRALTSTEAKELYDTGG